MSELPAPANKPTSSPQGKKLLDQLSDALRTQHYSYRTEETYIDWIRRYTLRVYHHPGLSLSNVKKHPAEMGAPEIRAFITHLAVKSPWIPNH